MRLYKNNPPRGGRLGSCRITTPRLGLFLFNRLVCLMIFICLNYVSLVSHCQFTCYFQYPRAEVSSHLVSDQYWALGHLFRAWAGLIFPSKTVKWQIFSSVSQIVVILMIWLPATISYKLFTVMQKGIPFIERNVSMVLISHCMWNPGP